jgi:hypothetical protein
MDMGCSQVRLEKEIQNWLEILVGKGSLTGCGDLYSAIRYDGSPLSLEMKGTVEYIWGQRVTPQRHRAVHEACRVLKSLIEPRFYSANENIGTPSEILRPDIILEDEISSAFVIIEIKRSRKAAREYATELLAYANALTRQHPGSQVFFVIISTTWATIEQHAFSKLIDWGIPCVALEYREECESESSQTLWVRSDILPEVNASKFPSKALRVETKVFWLSSNWLDTSTVNVINHAVSCVLREAEKTRASGFIIVWWHPHETPDRSQIRLYVSMAVRNSIREQKIPEFKNDIEALDFAWSNTFTELYDDTAIRLLLNFELERDAEYYSSESEGLWADLYERMMVEKASIFSFDSFGEIGDHISTWRMQARSDFASIMSDTALLATWHPLTWLPPLEFLIEDLTKYKGDSALDAFHLGIKLGGLCGISRMQARLTARDFGWGVAQANFAKSWCDYFSHRVDAPNLHSELGFNHFRLSNANIERALDYACGQMSEGGALVELCFVVGIQVATDDHYMSFLETRSAHLLRQGIRIPKRVIEEVNKVMNS